MDQRKRTLQARAQEEARSRAELGDTDGARTLLRQTAENLRRVAPSSKRAAQLEEQAAEMEAHEQRILFSGSIDQMTSKTMHYQSRGRQRKRNPDPFSG